MTPHRRILLVMLGLWGCYLFYPYQFSGESGVSGDAVFYLHIAKNIVRDGSLGWQATYAPPFYSMLIALVYYLTGNFVIAAVITTKLATFLLPFVVYLLAEKIIGPRDALLAAVLTMFHPHVIFVSSGMEPEAVYTLLMVMTFSLTAVVWFSIATEQPVRRPIRHAGITVSAGLTGSLAYQTRSEGLIVFSSLVIALTIYTIIKRLRGKGELPVTNNLAAARTKSIAALVVSFIIFSAPYSLFLRDTYGTFVLSPKASSVLTWMQTFIYDANKLGEQSNPELWGLSPRGKLMWQEPKGAGSLFEFFASDPGRNLTVYLKNFLRQFTGAIANNTGMWFYPQVFPWYFFLPAVFLAIRSVRRKDPAPALFLGTPFIMLFVLPVFSNSWWKYLYPYSPFLIILAAGGLGELERVITKRHVALTVAVVIVLNAYWLVWKSAHLAPPNRGVLNTNIQADMMMAGKWARERFGEDKNYMLPWCKLAWYLGGKWTAMPTTGYPGIIWYAVQHRADYIVFETFNQVERDMVMQETRNIDGIRLADTYINPQTGYGVMFLSLSRPN